MEKTRGGYNLNNLSFQYLLKLKYPFLVLLLNIEFVTINPLKIKKMTTAYEAPNPDIK